MKIETYVSALREAGEKGMFYYMLMMSNQGINNREEIRICHKLRRQSDKFAAKIINICKTKQSMIDACDCSPELFFARKVQELDEGMERVGEVYETFGEYFEMRKKTSPDKARLVKR